MRSRLWGYAHPHVEVGGLRRLVPFLEVEIAVQRKQQKHCPLFATITRAEARTSYLIGTWKSGSTAATRCLAGVVGSFAAVWCACSCARRSARGTVDIVRDGSAA